jgi:xylose dehydrogenase (NAD/NADP)
VPADNYRLDPRRGGGALLDVGSYAVAAAHWAMAADDVRVAEVARHVGPTGVDLTTSAVLVAGENRAQVTASFERAESQGLRVGAPGWAIELPGQAFTSWRGPSELRVTEGDGVRTETFEPCDAYRLMIEAISARITGRDAWVLPLSASAAVAATLDEIAATTSG